MGVEHKQSYRVNEASVLTQMLLFASCPGPQRPRVCRDSLRVREASREQPVTCIRPPWSILYIGRQALLCVKDSEGDKSERLDPSVYKALKRQACCVVFYNAIKGKA